MTRSTTSLSIAEQIEEFKIRCDELLYDPTFNVGGISDDKLENMADYRSWIKEFFLRKKSWSKVLKNCDLWFLSNTLVKKFQVVVFEKPTRKKHFVQKKKTVFLKKYLEDRGIDPRTFHMLSERSTI